MDGMDSLLGQPVNAMNAFMGSSKLDRPDDVGGLGHFDQYSAYGGNTPSMVDPSMSMMGNMPMGDMGMPSNVFNNPRGNNTGSDRMTEGSGDSGSVNSMIMNQMGQSMPNSMGVASDLGGAMGGRMDSMAMGSTDGINGSGLPGSGPDAPPNMGPSVMSGNGMHNGAMRGVGPMGNGPMGGANPPAMGLNGMDAGHLDYNMMGAMGGNGMNVGANDSPNNAPFNHQMRVPAGGAASAGAPGPGYPQVIGPNQMPGMPMHMEGQNGMFPMGPPVGMQMGPNQQPGQFMNNEGSEIMPPHLMDPQEQFSPMNRKRGSVASLKKSQTRAQTAKKATAQRNPRGAKAQVNKASNTPRMEQAPLNATQQTPQLSTQDARRQSQQPVTQMQQGLPHQLSPRQLAAFQQQQQQQQQLHQKQQQMLPQQMRPPDQHRPDRTSEQPVQHRPLSQQETQRSQLQSQQSLRLPPQQRQEESLEYMQQQRPQKQMQTQPIGPQAQYPGRVDSASGQYPPAMMGLNRGPNMMPMNIQSPIDPNSSNVIPKRQFEFSTQQPPPPRAPGALRLRIQLILTLNQELIRISMASPSGSDVFKGSMSRLESNLQYLRRVYLQQDTNLALSVPPPILGPIPTIPSLTGPYRRLKDLFQVKQSPS